MATCDPTAAATGRYCGMRGWCFSTRTLYISFFSRDNRLRWLAASFLCGVGVGCCHVHGEAVVLCVVNTAPTGGLFLSGRACGCWCWAAGRAEAAVPVGAHSPRVLHGVVTHQLSAQPSAQPSAWPSAQSARPAPRRGAPPPQLCGGQHLPPLRLARFPPARVARTRRMFPRSPQPVPVARLGGLRGCCGRVRRCMRPSWMRRAQDV